MFNFWIDEVALGGKHQFAAISDIHGAAERFEKLLARLSLAEDAHLFLLGDYLERGLENIQTLKRVCRMAKGDFSHPVHAVIGNNDLYVLALLQEGAAEEIVAAARNKGGRSFFAECAREAGFAELTAENAEKTRAYAQKNYAEELAWLSGLPAAIETEDYIFVHAGAGDAVDWRQSGHKLLKDDYFITHGKNTTGKRMFVGHMPASSHPAAGPSHNPLEIEDMKVVAIDGCNSVSRFGQLNAYILNKRDGRTETSSLFVDDERFGTAADDYRPEQPPLFKSHWDDWDIDVAEKGRYFSLCRRRKSGLTGLVKNEHIDWDKRRFRYDTVSAHLPVQKGEKLSILDSECEGYALARNAAGLWGWIPREILSL